VNKLDEGPLVSEEEAEAIYAEKPGEEIASEEESSDGEERLKDIVARLQTEADERVAKRQQVEQRWLVDLRQYHGSTDNYGITKDETQARPPKATEARSTLTINETRPKTNAMAAKLADLLFPTDDRNWGIAPTPVPELDDEAEAALKEQERAEGEAEGYAQQVAQAQQQGGTDPALMQAAQQQAQGAVQAADQAETVARRFQAQIDEARKRAERMALEIEDQLTECSYTAASRDVIEDACKIGTGIMEGPIVGDKTRAKWTEQNGEWVMQDAQDPKPRFRRIDPWTFFPDNDCKTAANSESFYVRELMNRKQLRRLAKVKGFSEEAIKNLVGKGVKPKSSLPQYVSDLRTLTGEQQAPSDELFTVWKFTGPLECEDVKLLAEAMGEDPATYEEDPLLEINAVVWFCDGELLKFSIHPLDSGEPLYSVFNLEKDEASIWGYGVPYIMRHPAAAMTAGWRMMLDNAGLSVGPQIIIDREKIEPADGNWELKPRKIWFSKVAIPKDERPFQTFDVPMHQQEIAGIINLANQFISDVTGITPMVQGEQGAGVTKTAQGMAILMNSANVVFRRIVKNFDDDMTVPNIRRLYDWNMQFNETPEIKGDFEVDARGSSVLLVREMQAQNLMLLAMQFGGHPIYGVMLKHADMLRTIFRAHMLKADEHVHDDKKIEELQKQQAEQAAQAAGAGQGMTPEEIALKEQEMEATVAIAEQDAATRRYVADKQFEAAQMRTAEDLNMQAEDIRTKLSAKHLDISSKERLAAVETAMAARTGEHAGGSI
jgi:hypothetical protein